MSEAGASALLMVSGDGGGVGGERRGSGSSSSFFLDARGLLREARALRDYGEIDDDVMLACVANPTMTAGG